MFFHVQHDEEEEEGCTLGMLFHIEPDDEEERCSLGQQEDKRKITQNNTSVMMMVELL
jgi:hypothetical protein